MGDSIPSMTILSEATLEQLFAEIAKRFDHSIVACVSNSGQKRENYRFFFSGGIMPGIGLARCVQMELTKKVVEADQLEDAEDKR